MRRFQPVPAVRCTRAAGARLLALAVILGGCKAPPPAPPPAPLSLADVLDRLHENNRQINRVYAAKQVALTAHFPDEAGRTRRVDLEGALLYRKPRDLYLDLRHVLTPVMRIGSNDQRYWMWILLDINTMRWGKYEHLDKPDIREFALRPDQVIEALGVNELPTDEPGWIGPLVQTTPQSYILIYARADPQGGYRIDREYHVDRHWPFLIRQILVRDALGQVVMDATLSDYKPLAGTGPLTATTIQITWPDHQADMRMRLSGLGLREAAKPQAFAFPTDPPVPPQRIIQIDRDYDQAEEHPAEP